MLSSVLRSKRAVQVNIAIMRAFVRLRRMLAKVQTAAVGISAAPVTVEVAVTFRMDR